MEPLEEIILEDRRLALRQPCRVETLVVEHEERGRFECRVVDISRKGIRLLMPVSLPCGSVIRIYPPQGMELRICLARIIRQQVVTTEEGDWFECGVAFTERAELRRHSWFLTLRQAA